MTTTLVSLRKYWRVFASIIALLVVVVSYSIVNDPASATHTPADKVVASGSTTEEFGPGTDVELLKATLRTAKPTDLIFNVSLECSILTKLTTGPSAKGGSSTDSREGAIRVWIEIDNLPNQIVPISSASAPPQNPPAWGTAADKVTFCNRTYQRTVTDSEDPLDGQDTEEDFIDTKAANAFNWLRLNLGSGIHTVRVLAEFFASSTPEACSKTVGTSCSTAVVGNRTLIVVPSKLANDATI